MARTHPLLGASTLLASEVGSGTVPLRRVTVETPTDRVRDVEAGEGA